MFILPDLAPLYTRFTQLWKNSKRKQSENSAYTARSSGLQRLYSLLKEKIQMYVSSSIARKEQYKAMIKDGLVISEQRKSVDKCMFKGLKLKEFCASRRNIY